MTAHGCTIGGEPAMPILISEHTQLVARLAEAEAELARLREAVTVIHQPIAGDGGPYCQTCTQDDIQPPPVGWWVPHPCPTIRALDTPEPTP